MLALPQAGAHRGQLLDESSKKGGKGVNALEDGRDISYMERRSNGQRVEFRHRNKVYEIDWDILPYHAAGAGRRDVFQPAGQP